MDSLLVVGDGFVSVHFVNLLLSKSSSCRIFVMDKCGYDCGYDGEAVCERDFDFDRLFKTYKFSMIISFADIDLSKYETDRFLQITDFDSDANVTVHKSYCYGARQSINEFLAHAIVSTIREEPIIVSNEFVKYDMLYVEDFCDALYKIMNFGNDGVYDVCSKFVIKEIDIARMILKRFELPLSFIEYSDCDVRTAEIIDNKNISSLGWRPKIEFDEGLDLTIKWFQKHVK